MSNYDLSFPCDIASKVIGYPCRCCLLILLAVCAGGQFILQQPRQSLLYRHPRFRWLTEVLCVGILLPPDYLSNVTLYDPWIFLGQRFSAALGGWDCLERLLPNDTLHMEVLNGLKNLIWVSWRVETKDEPRPKDNVCLQEGWQNQISWHAPFETKSEPQFH